MGFVVSCHCHVTPSTRSGLFELLDGPQLSHVISCQSNEKLNQSTLPGGGTGCRRETSSWRCSSPARDRVDDQEQKICLASLTTGEREPLP